VLTFREYLIVLVFESRQALRRYELWLPYAISSVLGLFVIAKGYQAFGGEKAQAFFVLGWVPMVMVIAGTLGTVSAVVSLSLGGLAYWLSLPLSVGQVVSAKLLAGVSTSLLVSLFALSVVAALILHDAAVFAPSKLVALMLLGAAIAGLLAALAVLVRDLNKLSVVTVLAGGVLQYVSDAYTPVLALPAWMRPLVFANPVSLASNVLRTGELSLLFYLTLEAALFFGAGVYALVWRVRRQLG